MHSRCIFWNEILPPFLPISPEVYQANGTQNDNEELNDMVSCKVHDVDIEASGSGIENNGNKEEISNGDIDNNGNVEECTSPSCRTLY